jgi:cleavage stimulation factor subunit 2
MRNLNGYEIGGRTLRVDNACTEKSRMEMAFLLQGPQVENPYGEHCDPEQAPEVITKTVASLPPEQMYELMKQMKACIQNNPAEARQMLMLNPQLAYALLQAQVVMRIVDPSVAVTFLHKANQPPPVLTTTSMSMPQMVPSINAAAVIPQPVPAPQGPGGFAGSGDVDLRPVDPRLARSMASMPMDQDMRSLGANPMAPVGVPAPMDIGFQRPQRGGMAPQQQQQPQFPADPRSRPMDPRDPRAKQAVGVPAPIPVPVAPVPGPQQQQQLSGIPSDASDQEKAALIMQVLQLSDEQIAMLPPEQRTSILVLKEQIAKSTQR